ncbi:hypothetical protein C5167_034367 [Papaver somniferum]|uniref:Uncharacterized protein n=1 Tax=Papaver somniferum TaxID=3469 RepID=A0A4Y7KGV7_PAPSO|nr:hypothetical protein C5167_034367 [Papaver somniferum]
MPPNHDYLNLNSKGSTAQTKRRARERRGKTVESDGHRYEKTMRAFRHCQQQSPSRIIKFAMTKKGFWERKYVYLKPKLSHQLGILIGFGATKTWGIKDPFPCIPLQWSLMEPKKEFVASEDFGRTSIHNTSSPRSESPDTEQPKAED